MSSNPTNEGISIAASIISQAKGDIGTARRVACDAHLWLCSVDPSYKASDDKKRIADLEAQVVALSKAQDEFAPVATIDNSAELASLKTQHQALQVDAITLMQERDGAILTANLAANEIERLTADRDNAIAKYDALLAHSGDAKQLRDELFAARAELQQLRALAPDKVALMAEVAGPLPLPAVTFVEPVASFSDVVSGKHGPAVSSDTKFVDDRTADEIAAPAALVTPLDKRNARVAAIAATMEPAKPINGYTNNADPVRPSHISEGAWASMSPMMRKFAAAKMQPAN